MNKFNTMRALQLAAGGALLMLASVASAQFVWVDAKGVKQFSDMPPPASVPANKILKQPGRNNSAAGAEDAAQTSNDAAASAQKATADRELDYRKRKQEKAEADAKAATLAETRAKQQGNCDAARARNAHLASGKRLRSADGAFMDNNERARQQETVSQALADCN